MKIDGSGQRKTSERCMIPRTREAGGTHRIQVIAWRRGTSDRSSARLPCPQVPQCHLRVAKGSSDRSSARLPCPQVPQCPPRVAKRVFWPVFGPSGGQHIRRTRGYAAPGPHVCIFSAREYVAPVRRPAYSVGPGIFIEYPESVALVDVAGWAPAYSESAWRFSRARRRRGMDGRHIHRAPGISRARRRRGCRLCPSHRRGCCRSGWRGWSG